MSLRSDGPPDRRLDDTDWNILAELQADARLSYSQLARRVHLSTPSVAERVRRMERDGVITGYHARVDPARVGARVSAFVELRCDPARCLLRQTKESDFPEIAEIHKLSGEYCAMLRVRTGSVEELEGLLEHIGQHGKTRASIVLSTQYDGRPVTEGDSDARSRGTSTSPGWRRS